MILEKLSKINKEKHKASAAKAVALAVILMLTAASLSACGGSPGSSGASGSSSHGSGKGGRLKVVTTSFAAWDWTRQVLGDRADDAQVTYLLDNGVDMHSYQPDAEDIGKILDADLFIYVGGTSDIWVKDVLKSADDPPEAIDLMETLGSGVKLEERVQGMEEEPGEEAGHEHGDEHEGEDGHSHSDLEYDEHVWMSPANAILFTRAIQEKLSSIDPDHAGEYGDNAASYISRLEELQRDYQEAVDGSRHKTIVVADRFPFRYLTDEFGIKYYAAFAGCSAESEASFDTVIFLAGKVSELDVPMVLRTETGTDDLPDTIIEASGRKNVSVGVLDSMQSVRSSQMENGVTYISIMRKDLKVIKRALN